MLLGIVALLGVGTGLFVCRISHLLDDRVTVTSLSPDNRLQAVLIERGPSIPFKLDRNFTINIGTAGNHPISETATVFTSPDEGRPIGSERLIWSQGNHYLLVVGRHFFVPEDTPRTKSGETLYLLIEVKSLRQWCNASQLRMERFGFADLAPITFSETIVPGESPGKN